MTAPPAQELPYIFTILVWFSSIFSYSGKDFTGFLLFWEGFHQKSIKKHNIFNKQVHFLITKNVFSAQSSSGLDKKVQFLITKTYSVLRTAAQDLSIYNGRILSKYKGTGPDMANTLCGHVLAMYGPVPLYLYKTKKQT